MLALCLFLPFGTHLRAQNDPLTIVGKVIDYQGRPVGDAEVACYEQVGWLGRDGHRFIQKTKSQADGWFSFIIKERLHEPVLVAHREGLALGWNMAHDPEGTDIILYQPSSIRGKVVDDLGNPIDNATVRVFLHHWVFSWWRGDMSPAERLETLLAMKPTSWFHCQTDAQGRFIFDHLPAGATADFLVLAPGRAPVTTCHPGIDKGRCWVVGEQEVHIVMSRPRRIAGSVMHERTGAPVPNVRILARPESHKSPPLSKTSFVSNAQGNLFIDGLAPGHYFLQTDFNVDHPAKWVSKITKVTITPEQDEAHVEINVGKGALLDVLLREAASGKPIAQAEVGVNLLGGDGFPLSKMVLTTDATGRGSFRLPNLDGRIWALRDDYGYVNSNEIIRLGEGEVKHYTIELERTVVFISGHVVDAAAQFVPHASVLLSGPVRHRSSKRGFFQDYFHSDSAPKAEHVLVRDLVSGEALRTQLVDPNSTRSIYGKLTLRPGHSLRGRIVDPEGAGIPAAYVQLLRRISSRRVTEVATDPQGFYCIPALPDFEDETTSLLIRAQNYGPIEVPCPKYSGKHTVEMKAIVLPPADQRIRGRVVDANDAPVPGAVVDIMEEASATTGQPPRTVLTDQEGWFDVSGVCAGPVRICSQGGYLDAHVGDRNLTVVQGQTRVNPQQSLQIGQALPDLQVAGLNWETHQGRRLLICIVDMTQRPSRSLLKRLTGECQTFQSRQIEVLLIQTSQIDAELLGRLRGQIGFSFPLGRVQNEETFLQAWGITSVPHIVLTDEHHRIVKTDLEWYEFMDGAE